MMPAQAQRLVRVCAAMLRVQQRVGTVVQKQTRWCSRVLLLCAELLLVLYWSLPCDNVSYNNDLAVRYTSSRCTALSQI
jgi:hypothetical protein